MRIWWCMALACFTGISAYNYGYNRGIEDAPETSFAEIEKTKAEIEISRLAFETARKIAPTTAECLPLILEDTIDLSGFCRERLGEEEQREHEFDHESRPEFDQP